MKKELLLAGLLTTFSLVVKSQVGINTSNPQGVFNIDGLKNNPTTGVPTASQAKDDLVMTSNGNLGLGLTTPGTTLDVNGAITNRETAVAVAGNAVIIPANVSLVQLTGAATGAVAISAPAAPNPGQRLIVYNNTTGGFGATLNGITIPNGKVLEFVFSNSSWRSTDGGAAGTTPVNIYTADGTLASNRTVIQGANTLAFTGTQTNAFSVDGNTLSVDAANDRVGVGTTTPTNKLVVAGTNAQPSALGTANTNATLRIDGNTSHALDLGTYTNAPFGSYISSQNKASATSLPLVLNPVGGNVGVNTTPGTALDVNGAITNRETALAVAGNAVAIPANVSLVQLTGAATGAVAISAPAAPNPGQRLIVYNNTTGGFDATLNGVTVPNGKALEFVFSNSLWRSTEGGAAGAAPVNIYTADGTLASNRTVIQGANTLAFTGTQTNAFSVNGNTLSVDAANGRVGVGTTTPTNKLVVAGTNAQPSALGTANTNATLRIDGNTNHALDFGTYANSPFGSYISSQSKTASTGLPLVLNPVGGNVGVGTNVPNNSALLDLTSSNKGLLLPRVSLSSTSDASTVPSPATGLMVYNNNTAMSPQGEGIYYNGGTTAAPNWGKVGPVSKMYFKYYAFSNPNGDFVSNFDTKIPTNKYTAIVVGSDTSNHSALTSGFKNSSTGYDFQVPDIYTFQQNGTWRIYADVPNATTNGVSNFSWGVRLLIISNEQMSLLSDVVYDLGGSSTGAATASPVP
ncbi:hypothetical protein EG346_21840 [Chryseobacterium carnipullorum]|uniref:Uncharacterized protein n=2 Tax=Chryseobacterium carnipullorum TaxID=1124835 RepID=A0A376E2U8_CHRCU|nr:hypothetical protein [Chryseobacterium carnipullorum]AZA50654.1 hypothetical protein EG346_21840 [Chryseobacterium carnipullorum]AZA65521.1 hypothetical protein EG345_12930 [Chryseobacterium carnipullorum]STD01137.1 Uncharacterised protein [Chryseobacterium carnipullorum]